MKTTMSMALGRNLEFGQNRKFTTVNYRVALSFVNGEEISIVGRSCEASYSCAFILVLSWLHKEQGYPGVRTL